LLNTSCIDREVLPVFLAVITPLVSAVATADEELVIMYDASGLELLRYSFGFVDSPVSRSSVLYVDFNVEFFIVILNVPAE